MSNFTSRSARVKAKMSCTAPKIEIQCTGSKLWRQRFSSISVPCWREESKKESKKEKKRRKKKKKKKKKRLLHNQSNIETSECVCACMRVSSHALEMKPRRIGLLPVYDEEDELVELLLLLLLLLLSLLSLLSLSLEESEPDDDDDDDDDESVLAVRLGFVAALTAPR